MLNFKKYYILKIINILITGVFIIDTAGYGYALPNKSSLRVPSMATTEAGRNRLEESAASILNKDNNDTQLQELMAYIAGDELPGSEKKHFEDLKDIEDVVREFLETEIKPGVQEWEDKGTYKNKQEDKVHAEPLEDALKKTANSLGNIFGVSVPAEYNGLGYRHYYTYRIIKMLSYFWPSLAVTIGVNASVMDAINKFGTKEQKEKLLPNLASKGLGAIAITESDAGSDVMNMKTFARKEGGSYILDGTKLFITSAGIASTYIVFAVTDKGEGPDHKKKISAFLVNEDTPGFSIGKIEKKLGQKASPTGELVFKNCKIPEEAMLGKPGEGMKILYYMLTGGRIGIASLALGIARAAYDAAAGYAKERKQFGKAIGEFPQIKEKLINMKFYIDASEVLIKYASYLKDQDPNASKDINAMVTAASMAKLFSTEKGKTTAVNALQIHGGYGYTKEYPLARYLRDIVVTTIYEGTSEIQQNIIKKHISLFLNSETDIEKTIDSYFKAHPAISGHEQEIATIYEAMNKAKEKLHEAIEEKRETHHDSDLLVDLVITRMMLFKTIFLANQEDIPQEDIEKNLNDALLASKFLRRALNDYETFAPLKKDEGILAMEERLLKEKDFGLGALADDEEVVKILVRFQNDLTFLRENAEKALIALDKTIFERCPNLSAFLDTLFTTPPAVTADQSEGYEPKNNASSGRRKKFDNITEAQIIEAMRKVKGVRKDAARLLNMHENTFPLKVKEFPGLKEKLKREFGATGKGKYISNKKARKDLLDRGIEVGIKNAAEKDLLSAVITDNGGMDRETSYAKDAQNKQITSDDVEDLLLSSLHKKIPKGVKLERGEVKVGNRPYKYLFCDPSKVTNKSLKEPFYRAGDIFVINSDKEDLVPEEVKSSSAKIIYLDFDKDYFSADSKEHTYSHMYRYHTILHLIALQELDLKGKIVADAGAGNGVMAIAAFMLGANKVYAFDEEDDFKELVKENAGLNNIEKHNIDTSLFGIPFSYLSKHKEKTKVDIVLLNNSDWGLIPASSSRADLADISSVFLFNKAILSGGSYNESRESNFRDSMEDNIRDSGLQIIESIESQISPFDNDNYVSFIVGFPEQVFSYYKSVRPLQRDIKIARPSKTTLAFNDLEKEWNDVASNSFQENDNKMLKEDTFLNYGSDKALKPIIEKDITMARGNNRELVYIVSCGQKEDVSWLINTLSELIPEGERLSWTVAIVVTNMSKEPLQIAKKVLSVSGFPVHGYFIKINMGDKKQSTTLNNLLSKHGLSYIADGVMHNMGGALWTTRNGNITEYYKLLHSWVKEGSWLQIDREYVKAAKGLAKFSPADAEKCVELDKALLNDITNCGFSMIKDIKDEPFAIFRPEANGVDNNQLRYTSAEDTYIPAALELSSIISLKDKEFSKVEVDINYKEASELLQKIDASALNHELRVLTEGFDAENPDVEILKAINDKTQKALNFINGFIYNDNLDAGLRNTVADVLDNEFEDLKLANKTEQYSEIKPALKTALEQANLFREILQRRELINIEKYDKAGGFDISGLPETNEMSLFIAKDVLAHPAGFIESWYKYSQPKINILIQDEKEKENINRLMELGLVPQDAGILFKEDLSEIKNKEKIILGFKENIHGELPGDIQQFQFASLGEGELLNWERPFALLLLRLGIGISNLPESCPFNKVDLGNPNTGESIYAIPVGVKVSVESSTPAVSPSEKLIHTERFLSISL